MDLAAATTANWADALLDDGFWLGPEVLRLPPVETSSRRKAAAKRSPVAARPRRARPLRAARIPA